MTALENNIIVYKFVQDLHFFVTGGEEENELVLASVLQGLFDAVNLLLRSCLIIASVPILPQVFRLSFLSKH